MKKILILAAAAVLSASCEHDASFPPKGGDANRVTELAVPASFEWNTTASVVCDFTATGAAKVLVSTSRQGEPFAEFTVGEGTEPVKLDLPQTVGTLYVSYRTETGVSEPEPVAVAGGRAVYTLPAAAAAAEYRVLAQGDDASTEGGVIFMPARKNGWGTLLFEDMWPAYGDYDFNDAVINYKVQLYLNERNLVDAMLIGVRVKAIGGSMPYDLYLMLHGVYASEIEEIVPYDSHNAPEGARMVAVGTAQEAAAFKFENIRSNPNRPEGSTYLNTDRGYELSDDDLVDISYAVYFSNPISSNYLTFDTFDFYLGRVRETDGRRIEIHMGGFKPSLEARADYEAIREGNPYIGNASRPYYSNDNLVWAVHVPQDVRHGYERVDFLETYPQFKTWAQSGGTLAQDWYLHGVSSNQVKK